MTPRLPPAEDAAPAWFATCPKGLEALLAAELSALGATAARETVAGVHFSGPRALACRACLWSRLANRILWPLGQLPAADGDALYRAVREIDWTTHFAAEKTFAIDFSGTNDAIRNTQFGAQRVKDAIVDGFVAALGRRPSVDRVDPDIRIQVRLLGERAQFAFDLSGASLHQRGYRLQSGVAPMKENLAAGVLLRAGWPPIAARGGALLDPMCGAGTLLIEGALMAADIAPALARARFGFEHLSLHDSAEWEAILGEARERARRGRAAGLPPVRGFDWDPAVIRRASENIARAGLQDLVEVSCKPVAQLSEADCGVLPRGLLVCNPPWGERIGDSEPLAGLYRQLGELMHDHLQGWQAAVLTADLALGRATGLRSHKRYALYNGAIATSLLLFELTDNALRDGRAAPEPPAPALTAGATMFANRVAKNRKRLAPWVRRERIDCYRVYDADLPEYAVAVDVYGQHAHVAEYQAPRQIPVEVAARRLDEVRSALPVALGIPAANIVYKQRSRQRGRQQYARQGDRGELLTVGEGAVKLLVNLHDYIDTGLFLDHRPLRLRLAREATGKDFLNLFCYTGAATVHAAWGGAHSTTSVDLSNTYLDWLRRNLEANGLQGDRHALVREDCRGWLARSRNRYDLILLDPPSFSNSKAMRGSFDVQRDHADLLRLAMARLRGEGRLYFSCNRRGFALDAALQEEFLCEDITSRTLPPDFQRNPGIHCCWLVRHRAQR